MSPDAIDEILRLVADGHLTAAEAEPILAALDRVSARTEPATDTDPDPASSKASSDGAAGRAIRIEVSESGRQVVNLRVPLALGRSALARIPGLSESLTERAREAIESGFKGSIVEVDDDGDGVRIFVE